MEDQEPKKKRKRGRKMKRKRGRGAPKKIKPKKKIKKKKPKPYKYYYKMTKNQKQIQAHRAIKKFIRLNVMPELLYELNELISNPELPPEWFEAEDENITKRILERIVILDEDI